MASEDLHDVNTCSTMIPVLTRLTWRPVTWKEGREKRRKFGYCQVQSSEHIAGIQWSRLDRCGNPFLVPLQISEGRQQRGDIFFGGRGGMWGRL